MSAAPAWLTGRWYALFRGTVGDTPRIFEFREGPAGLEGTIIGNSGDYSHFSGEATRDSFALSRFDGSFVYLLAGRLVGDTLRGTFHAGLKAQTMFDRGARARAITAQATDRGDAGGYDGAIPLRVSRREWQSWCRATIRSSGARCWWSMRSGPGVPPATRPRPPWWISIARDTPLGLEMVGLAYEVSGDSAVDGALVRRYRDKFDIPFPLLLAGTNDVDAAAATLPQLVGFTAFPTTIFIGRDGRVRQVHAGFYGPATGAQHGALVAEFTREVDLLLAEPAPVGRPVAAARTIT